MLRRFIHARIRAFERRYDYDARYLHELAECDGAAFRAFTGAAARLGRPRAGLPAATWFGARLAAMLAEDCGPCTQLNVDMAREAGVDASTLRALLAGTPDAASGDAALGFRFAQAVIDDLPTLTALRAAVVTRYGAAAPAALGLAVVGARLYPPLKRAMGHAGVCTPVTTSHSGQSADA